ncbi:MAG: DUF4350 domain-containing protein [Carboxylicivirga sp.]|jgi:hypothetical protein|nr:DUF4350 domain-containing protein [Carboxylicivirga sp.]
MKGSSSNKVLIIAMVLIALIVVMVLSNSPKTIDWTLSFSKQDTKPYGSKLLFEQLNEVVDRNNIQTSHGTFFDYFIDGVGNSTNLIVVNNSFRPDDDDLFMVEELLRQGANIFLSASDLSDSIKSIFDIEYRQHFGAGKVFTDSVSFNLANRKLRTHLGYWYKKGITNNYFTSYDSIRTTVLGINSQGKTNFIKVRHNEGNIYINLNPQAFTNYNMLVDDNYEYAFKCLSYLPNQKTIWDEHYKYKYLSGSGETVRTRSILSFVLDRTPLRMAWYLLLIGILIFFFFGSARRQRVVPIVKPPVNSTISFIQTIGRLYFSRRNHLDIARKRFQYLQEFIRSKYFINTSDIDDELIHQLADKTSIPARSIKQLFDMGNNLKRMKSISEEDLEQLNRRIEFFYEQCK